MLYPSRNKYLLLCIAVVALLPTTVLAGEKLRKADRIPAALTAEQKALITEGIALHDAGQYDGAIAKYKQVLDHAPDEVLAMYELGFAHFAKKDYESALAVARRGVQYRSELLPGFYELLGNCLDDLGKREDAIDVYKAGIKHSPMKALLHFNLAVALFRSEKHLEARKAMQKSVSLDPNHPSSHYLLASLYHQLGYRVPAILAFSRFCLLEPGSERAKGALSSLDQLLGGDVTKGDKPNEIKINVAFTPDSMKDEGDFDAIAMAISMSSAAAHMKAKEESSQFKLLTRTYAVMADVMTRTNGKGFAVKYYVPFFAELDKRELVEAFVYQTFQAAQLAGSAEWGKENGAKLREFDAWLSSYRWSSMK